MESKRKSVNITTFVIHLSKNSLDIPDENIENIPTVKPEVRDSLLN